MILPPSVNHIGHFWHLNFYKLFVRAILRNFENIGKDAQKQIVLVLLDLAKILAEEKNGLLQLVHRLEFQEKLVQIHFWRAHWTV